MDGWQRLRDWQRRLPKGADWLRGPFFSELVEILVADRIRPRENLTEVPTPQGRFLSAQAGGGSDPAPYPFEAVASAWQGTGADPYAEDRAMRFRLRRGKIAGRTPANVTAEFRAFGTPMDTTRAEEDAVVTQVYTSVPVAESTLGSGDIVYSRPTLAIIGGADLREALGEEAYQTPENGALPPVVYVPLCEVLWWGGSLHFTPGVRSYLGLDCAITGTQCGEATRQIVDYGYVYALEG